MDTSKRVTEIPDPQGGRNLIRAGDTVRYDPGLKKKKVLGTFHFANTDGEGTVESVTIFTDKWRVLLPEKIHRVAQTVKGQKKEFGR